MRQAEERKHQEERAKKDEVDVLARADHHVRVNFRHDTAGFPVGKQAQGESSRENGKYSMLCRDTARNAFLLRSPSLGRFSELVLQVKMGKVEGEENGRFGLRFGAPWPDNYYRFEIQGNGRVSITSNRDKKWRNLSVLENCDYLNRGDASNLMKLVRASNAIHLWLNGHCVTTAKDDCVKSGHIGFSVGPGLHVHFFDLRIDGILDLDWMYARAIQHRDALKGWEAAGLLRQIFEKQPDYKDVQSLLTTPAVIVDHRDTVFIVYGEELLPSAHEGPLAQSLRERIDRKGRGYPCRFSVVVPDHWYLENSKYHRCPIISLGGSQTNKVTAKLMSTLPQDDSLSTGHVFIHHNLQAGDGRVLLWGSGYQETAEAVKKFRSELLDRFLNNIWTE